MQEPSNDSYSFFENSPLYHPSVKSHEQLGQSDDQDEPQLSPPLTRPQNQASPRPEDSRSQDDQLPQREHEEQSSQRQNEAMVLSTSQEQPLQNGASQMSPTASESMSLPDHQKQRSYPLAPSPPPRDRDQGHEEGLASPTTTAPSVGQVEPERQERLERQERQERSERSERPERQDFVDFAEQPEPKYVSIPSPMVQQQVVHMQQQREQRELMLDGHQHQQQQYHHQPQQHHLQPQQLSPHDQPHQQPQQSQSQQQHHHEQDFSPTSQTSAHSYVPPQQQQQQQQQQQSQREGGALSPAGSVSSLMQSSSPEISMRQTRPSFSSGPVPIRRDPPRDQNAFQPSSIESYTSVGKTRHDGQQMHGGSMVGGGGGAPGGSLTNVGGGGVSLDNMSSGVDEAAQGPWGSSQIQGSTSLRHGSFGSAASPVSLRGDQQQGFSSTSSGKDTGGSSAGVIARPTPPSTTGSAIGSAPPSAPIQKEQGSQQGYPFPPQVRQYSQQGTFGQPQHQPAISPQQQQQHQPPPLQQQPGVQSTTTSAVISPAGSQTGSSYPFSPNQYNISSQSSNVTLGAPPQAKALPKHMQEGTSSPTPSTSSFASPPPVLHNVPPPAPSAPPPTERYQMPPGVAQAFNAAREASSYQSTHREAAGNSQTYGSGGPPYSPTGSGNVMSAGSSSLNPNRLSGGYPSSKPQVGSQGQISKNSPKIGTGMGAGMGGVSLGGSSQGSAVPQKMPSGQGSSSGSYLVGAVRLPTSSIELPRPPSIFEEDPIPTEYRPGKRNQHGDDDSRIPRIPEKPGSGASHYSAGSMGKLREENNSQNSARQGLGISSPNAGSYYSSPPMPSLGSGVGLSTRESVMRGQWGSTTATSIPASSSKPSGLGGSDYGRGVGLPPAKAYDEDLSPYRKDMGELHGGEYDAQRHPQQLQYLQKEQHYGTSGGYPSEEWGGSQGGSQSGSQSGSQRYRPKDGSQRGGLQSSSDYQTGQQYQQQHQQHQHGLHHQQQQQNQRYEGDSYNSMPRPGQLLQHLHSQVQAATERAHHHQQQQQQQQPQHHPQHQHRVSSGSSLGGGLPHAQAWSAGSGSDANYTTSLGQQYATQQQGNLGHGHSHIPRRTSPLVHPQSPEGVYQHTNPSVGPTPELPILSHPSLRRTKSMEQKENEDDYHDSLSQLYPTLPTDHLRSLHRFALYLFEDAMAADRADKIRGALAAANGIPKSSQSLLSDDDDDVGDLSERLQQIGRERMKKWRDWVDVEDTERRRVAGVAPSGSRLEVPKPPQRHPEGSHFSPDNDTVAGGDEQSDVTFSPKFKTEGLPPPRNILGSPDQFSDVMSKVESESQIKYKKPDNTQSLLDLDDDESQRPTSPPENLLSPSPTPTYIQVAAAPKVDLELQMPRPMISVPAMRLDPSANRRHDDDASTVAESELGDPLTMEHAVGSTPFPLGLGLHQGPLDSDYRGIDSKALNGLLASFNRGNVGRNGAGISGRGSPSQDIPPLLHQAYAALETATNNPSLETYLKDVHRSLEQKTIALFRDAEGEAMQRRQMHQSQTNMLYASRRLSPEDLERTNIDFEKQEARKKLEVEKRAYMLFENEYVEVAYKDVKRQLEILGGKWYEDVKLWLLQAATSPKTNTAMDYHLVLECIDLLNKLHLTMEQHEHVLQSLVSERNARYLQISIAPLVQVGDEGRAKDAQRRFWIDEQERQLIAKKEAVKRAKEHFAAVETIVTDLIRGLKRKFEEIVDSVNGIIFQFPRGVLPELFRRFFDYNKGQKVGAMKNQQPDSEFQVPKSVIEILRESLHNLSDLLGLIKFALDFQNDPQIKVLEAKCSLQVAEDHARTSGLTSPSATNAACSAGLAKLLPGEIKRLREEQADRWSAIQEEPLDVLRRLNAMVLAFEKDPRLPSYRFNEHQQQLQQHWNTYETELQQNHHDRWGSQSALHHGNVGGQMHGLQNQQMAHHSQHVHHGQQPQQHGLLQQQHQQHQQHQQQQHYLQQQGPSQLQLQQQQQQRQPLPGPQGPALKTMLGNLRAGGHNFGVPQSSGGSSYAGFTPGSAGAWNNNGSNGSGAGQY